MILVFDVETTGRSAGTHEIVQIAGVLLDRRQPGLPEVASFCSYLRPLRPQMADPQALEVNRLTLAGLVQQRHPAEVLGEFAAFAGRASEPVILSGHYVQFDIGFLEAAEREHGFFVPRAKAAPLCTCNLAKKILGRTTVNHKLGTLAAHYGIAFDGNGAHDALSDVRVTAELLRRLHREAPAMFGAAIPPALLAAVSAPTVAAEPVAVPDHKVTPIRPSIALAPLGSLDQELARARRELKVARDHFMSTGAFLDVVEACEKLHQTPEHQAYQAARKSLAMLEEMAGDSGEEVA